MTDKRTAEERATDLATYNAWAHEASAAHHIGICNTICPWWCPCWCHRHGHARRASA